MVFFFPIWNKQINKWYDWSHEWIMKNCRIDYKNPIILKFKILRLWILLYQSDNAIKLPITILDTILWWILIKKKIFFTLIFILHSSNTIIINIRTLKKNKSKIFLLCVQCTYFHCQQTCRSFLVHCGWDFINLTVSVNKPRWRNRFHNSKKLHKNNIT